jgi:GTP-binding protein
LSALIIALNKWDVAENASSLFNGVKGALEDGLSQLKGVTLLTVSAKSGKGIDVLFKAAFDLRDAWSRRVGTGELNRWFEKAVDANPPPAPGGKRIKLRYVTQVKSRPPSFVIFGSRVDQLPDSYQRYLVNSMRKDLGLGAIPLRLTMRSTKNPYHDANPGGGKPPSASRTRRK